ncbi:MAG: 2-amino-4-hydroxy-6-hydroxymethyldihydropteridine diphosphokinase [Planctomycetia bacterium]|nr:2-amino-4-hydroxy-6-hydroxymethyldihydropteridine diphosphokinase [Planctomycetia bacterium]
MSKNVAQCLISIGSKITLLRVSRRHLTPPIGGPAGQSAFVNAAALVDTSLTPIQLLDALQAMESRAGRTRAVRWGPRPLDLDMLLYDDIVMNDARLVLPHPRMAFRRFALAPAAEVAPHMSHPQLRRSILQLLEHLDHASNYVAITGSPNVGKSRLVKAVAARMDALSVLDAQPRRQSNDSSSPSPSLQTELEFLSRRCELLRGVASSGEERYSISNFWLGQCLAYAEELRPEERRQVELALLEC